MKKILFTLFTMFCCMTASAHIFDGIDLNGNISQITRAISLKGYTTDPSTNKLKGNCQGTEIFLTLNYKDVTEKNKLGQLIIDVPMKATDVTAVSTVFNVIYHQTSNANGVYTYVVDEDGTTMTLTATENGVKMVYNTPYYKK